MLIQITDKSGNKLFLREAEIQSWSLNYGESGSGYGYLKFSAPYSLHTLGFFVFGNSVRLLKGLSLIFFGQIRNINQKSSGTFSVLEVVAQGDLVIAGDDELNWNFCDTRLSSWKARSEVEQGNYTPQLYTTGTTPMGIYFHPSNNQNILSGQFTALDFNYEYDETVKRMSFVLSQTLGSGIFFDSRIFSKSGNRLRFYNPYSPKVLVGMYIFNDTRGNSALIEAQGPQNGEYIDVKEAEVIASWNVNDKVYVFGPCFSGKINNIDDKTIYFYDVVGGENLDLATSGLFNVTRKVPFLFSSWGFHEPSQSWYVTADDEDDVIGFEKGDLVIAPGYLYSARLLYKATINGKPALQVFFESGRSFVSSTVGWVLSNITRGGVATVSEWYESPPAKFVILTSANDIQDWEPDDLLAIGSPFRIKLVDPQGNTLWPSDWRDGSRARIKEPVSVSISNDPRGVSFVCECYIPGMGNELICAVIDKIKVFSVGENVTAARVALKCVELLAEHGITNYEIEPTSKVLEPLFFEFQKLADVLTSVCKQEDENARLAWGFRFDDTRTFFLEHQNRSKIGYYIYPSSELGIELDIGGGFQVARGVYTDKLSRTQVSEYQTRPDRFFNNNFRRTTVRLDNIDTEDEADEAIGIYLDTYEKGKIGVTITVNDGDILDANLCPVAIEMIRPGQMVSFLTPDAERDGEIFTSRMLTSVEIDWSNRKVSLTLEEERDNFSHFMEELSRSMVR